MKRPHPKRMTADARKSLAKRLRRKSAASLTPAEREWLDLYERHFGHRRGETEATPDDDAGAPPAQEVPPPPAADEPPADEPAADEPATDEPAADAPPAAGDGVAHDAGAAAPPPASEAVAPDAIGDERMLTAGALAAGYVAALRFGLERIGQLLGFKVPDGVVKVRIDTVKVPAKEPGAPPLVLRLDPPKIIHISVWDTIESCAGATFHRALPAGYQGVNKAGAQDAVTWGAGAAVAVGYVAARVYVGQRAQRAQAAAAAAAEERPQRGQAAADPAPPPPPPEPRRSAAGYGPVRGVPADR